jgi:hypothetical protein
MAQRAGHLFDQVQAKCLMFFCVFRGFCVERCISSQAL